MGEVAPRSDARLDARDALVLTWTYDSREGEDEAFAFREAVGTQTGLTVQQVAACGARVGGPGNWSCIDERAAVLLAAQGLPGAFGAAPHWNETLEVGSGSISLENPIWPIDELGLDVHPPSAPTPAEGPCLAVDPIAESTDNVRALRFSGGLGTFTLCESYALPVRFETLGGAEYRLVEHNIPGDRLALDPSPRAWTAGDRPVPHRDIPFPLTVTHPDHGSPLPVPEAHEEAMNRSEPYASVFDEGGLLVGTHLSAQSGGWNNLTTEERRTDERRLRAVGPDGFAVDVRIEKHREAIGPPPARQEAVTYEIKEETTGDWPGPIPTPTSLADRQAKPSAGIELLETLTNRSLDRAGFGLWTTVDEAPWGHHLEDASLRVNGSVLVVWFKPPDAGLQYVPWQGVVDGPTATVLWFDVDRDRLPFTGVEGH